MRYAILSALSIALAAPVAAEPHGHIWTDPVCEAPTCIGRCCSKKCSKRCTGCKLILVWSDTACANEGGATGEYSTPLVGPWGPRPGAGGPSTQECPPHDPGPATCGGWSRVSDSCEVQHCTRQCTKCGSNRGDYFNSRPSGCFDE